jgi:hypothetical protein
LFLFAILGCLPQSHAELSARATHLSESDWNGPQSTIEEGLKGGRVRVVESVPQDSHFVTETDSIDKGKGKVSLFCAKFATS